MAVSALARLAALVALGALLGRADADADVEQADAVRFQAFLHARQYPADCRRTSAVVTRTGARPDGTTYAGNYFYGLGLGSQLVSLKFNFMRALLQGRVYHFPTSHYVNPVRCPSRSFDCYFEPPSNCTRPPVGGGGGQPTSAP